MEQRKKLIIILICLLVFAGLAFMGGMLGKKKAGVEDKEGAKGPFKCDYDGTTIRAIYEVDAFLADGKTLSFCSIYCAARWFERNKDKVVYMTVVDEVTGQRFDSTLGHFVESEVVTIPEVNNRIHAFAVKQDAHKHAGQFKGRLIENPFGARFVLPASARFDKLRIGVPSSPDAIPIQLAVFRPIFKENRLDVEIVSFRNENEGRNLFTEGTLDGIICDLPAGLALANGTFAVRIVKNVLRANPFRALFAIVASDRERIRDLEGFVGKDVAVPDGITFQFYCEFYLARAGVPVDKVRIRRVQDPAEAWDLLNKREVDAALLRTPYTDMAAFRQMTFLAHDRTLPWMSVLALKESIITEKSEAIKRFIFGLEQSVLALNVKPNEFRAVVEEMGGIPEEAKKEFPTPLFEGGNAPAPDEIEPIVAWLVQEGLLKNVPAYEKLVNSGFLPNPQDVGLAFCCR